MGRGQGKTNLFYDQVPSRDVHDDDELTASIAKTIVLKNPPVREWKATMNFGGDTFFIESDLTRLDGFSSFEEAEEKALEEDAKRFREQIKQLLYDIRSQGADDEALNGVFESLSEAASDGWNYSPKEIRNKAGMGSEGGQLIAVLAEYLKELEKCFDADGDPVGATFEIFDECLTELAE